MLVQETPLGLSRSEHRFDVGATIEEVLADLGVSESAGASVRVRFAGRVVEPEWYARLRPRSGTTVAVLRVPRATVTAILVAISGYLATAGVAVAGAVGLGGAASIIGSAAAAGIIGGLGLSGVVATIVAGTVVGLTGLAIGLGATIGLSLAVRAISGSQRQGATRSGASSPGVAGSPTLQGFRNQVLYDQPVWDVYGEHVVKPPVIGMWSYAGGSKQYAWVAYSLGWGPVEVDQVEIANTPIANYPGAQFFVKQGYPGEEKTLPGFPSAVSTELLNIDLPKRVKGQERWGDFFQRTTQPDATRIGVEFYAGQGLLRINEEGQEGGYDISVTIEYAQVDASGVPIGAWLSALATPGFSIRTSYASASSPFLVIYAQTRVPFYVSVEWPVTEGQYAVRVRRYESHPYLEGDQKNARAVYGALAWTSMRTERGNQPTLRLDRQAALILYVELTAGSQGVIDVVSCRVRRLLQTWDPVDGWSAGYTHTRNAIWALLNVLRGPANPRPLLSDRSLDLPRLYAAAQKLDAEGRHFDAVVDFDTVVSELCNDIAASQRGAFIQQDGRYFVVLDRAQTDFSDVFTSRESWDISVQQVIGGSPHALRCQFVDAADDYRADAEVEVFDDGFSEIGGNGTQRAERFEQRRVWGVTSRDWVYRDALADLRASRLAPAVYRLKRVEAVIAGYGDLVGLTYDVPLFGGGAARVKAVTLDGGGNATHVELDDDVIMEAGQEYTARFRSIHASVITFWTARLVTDPAERRVLRLASPLPSSRAPAKGDLATWGRTGYVEAACLVKAVRRSPDGSAEYELVDYVPSVYDAAAVSPPAYAPAITVPPVLGTPSIPAPRIVAVLSDESAMLKTAAGELVPRILVVIQSQDGAGTVSPSAVQVRVREQDVATGAPGEWRWLANQPGGSDRVAIDGVIVGRRYDVHVRYLAPAGVTSEWSPADGIVVVGATTVPPDILDLRLEGGAMLRWSYDEPVDLLGFLVRTNVGSDTSWASAEPCHDGYVSGSSFSIDGYARGTRTFLVKPVDRGLREAANAAVVIRDLGDLATANVVETQDEQAGGFTGTKTRCTVSVGVLQADEIPSAFYGPDDRPFYDGAAADPFYSSVYEEMIYEFEVAPAAGNVPGHLSIDVSAEGAPYRLEYAKAAPFYIGVGGDPFYIGAGADPFYRTAGELVFVPFPGRAEAEAIAYGIRLTIPGGAVRGRVLELAAAIDVPDVRETLEDVAIAAGGTRLPVTKTYRAIRRVTVALQRLVGETGSGVVVKDKATTIGAGPLVQVLDDTNTGVAGTVDAEIAGY